MKAIFIFALVCGICLCEGPKWTGLIAATFTPFDKDGKLNLSVLPAYADYLVKYNVTTIFVGGTTGESLIMTLEERKKQAVEWVKVGHQKGIKVIIHCGCDSLKEARELAEHAQSIGADAIGAMPTVFFKPATLDVLVQEMKYIAAGAPKLDFLYYHLPSMTGVALKMPDFMLRAYDEIPTFAGIKFTDVLLDDITEMQQIVKEKGKGVSILYGRDEQYDSALFMGVDGGVGSTYNYAPQIYNYIIGNYTQNKHDLVRLNQYRSQKFVRIFSKYSGTNYYPNKYLASWTMGIDLGPPRLPYEPLPDDMFEKMKEELTKEGYKDWLN